MYSIELNAINKILKGKGYINIVINETIKQEKLDDSRKNLFTKIVYGVVENKMFLDYQLSFYLKNSKINYQIINLLRLGIYMIFYLNIKKYHTINAIVEMSKTIDSKYSNMINAILRNASRNGIKEVVEEDYLKKLSITYSYPLGVVQFLYKQYPNDIENILKPNTEVFNTYRINALKTNETDILKELDFDYILKDQAIITKKSLVNHPLFINRKLVFQGYSSQQVATILNPKPNEAILDMCAAPGQKSFHIASLTKNKAFITSCDIHDHKIELMKKEAILQGVDNITYLVVDSQTHNFDKTYDKIILDAPCSGLGVMMHKCDLKYQINYQKIQELKNIQKALLGKACKVLKSGGTLVYSTCTINKEENELMMEYFLKKHKEFKKELEVKYLPSIYHDGFYICKLIKE